MSAAAEGVDSFSCAPAQGGFFADAQSNEGTSRGGARDGESARWTLAPPVLGAHGAADVCSGVWESMRDGEVKYAPDSDYFAAHPDLNPAMRAIMVDWMMEVCQEFLLKRETLHLAINYVDRFFSRTRGCHKLRVQLVGVSALCIAAKLEEIYPPKVEEFAATCDGAYTRMDLVRMERAMLECLHWQVVPATPYTWAVWYVHQLAARELAGAGAGTSEAGDAGAPSAGLGAAAPVALALDATPRLPTLQFNRALFERVMAVADAAAIDSDSLRFLPSVLAAAALYVVTSDDVGVESVTRYRLPELRDCAAYLRSLLAAAPARVVRHAREAYIRSKVHGEGTLRAVLGAIQARERSAAERREAVRLLQRTGVYASMLRGEQNAEEAAQEAGADLSTPPRRAAAGAGAGTSTASRGALRAHECERTRPRPRGPTLRKGPPAVGSAAGTERGTGRRKRSRRSEGASPAELTCDEPQDAALAATPEDALVQDPEVGAYPPRARPRYA